jgi:hypothetical protein
MFLYKNILCNLYIMSIKFQSIGALFVALVIILAINPTIVHNMYSSILGRLFLILIVIFFSINNITLGLLIVLTIITALNQYGSFVEGMENTTIDTSKTQENISKKKSELENNIANETVGVDKEDMKVTIMSKDSKQIPIDHNMNKSIEVNAASSGMLNSTSAKLEGFSTFSTLY